MLTTEIFTAPVRVLPNFPTGPALTEIELEEVSSSFKAVSSSCETGSVAPGGVVNHQVIQFGAALHPAGMRCNFQRAVPAKCPGSLKSLHAKGKPHHSLLLIWYVYVAVISMCICFEIYLGV